MLMALLLQAAAPDVAAFDKLTWGRFSRAAALRHTREEVTVASAGHDAATNTNHFRFRLVSRAPGGAPTERWTDTRICPAARAAVARFAEVPMPRLDPPTTQPGDITILADGIDYSVTVPVGYGKGNIADPVTFQSNVGTPLAAWVEASFATLAPCWSLIEVRIG